MSAPLPIRKGEIGQLMRLHSALTGSDLTTDDLQALITDPRLFADWIDALHELRTAEPWGEPYTMAVTNDTFYVGNSVQVCLFDGENNVVEVLMRRPDGTWANANHGGCIIRIGGDFREITPSVRIKAVQYRDEVAVVIQQRILPEPQILVRPGDRRSEDKARWSVHTLSFVVHGDRWHHLLPGVGFQASSGPTGLLVRTWHPNTGTPDAPVGSPRYGRWEMYPGSGMGYHGAWSRNERLGFRLQLSDVPGGVDIQLQRPGFHKS